MDRRWLFALGCTLALAHATPARADAPSEAEMYDAKAQTDAALSTMGALSSRLRSLLQRVRREGQRPAVACVDDGLTRVDVALRQGREIAQRQSEAWKNGDADEARAQLRRVLLLRDNARHAARAVDACMTSR